MVTRYSTKNLVFGDHFGLFVNQMQEIKGNSDSFICYYIKQYKAWFVILFMHLQVTHGFVMIHHYDITIL